MGEELKEVVENLHNCVASFIEDIAVIEKFENKTIWKGIVSIFNLKDHQQATKAYAWASPTENTKKHRYYAVLNIPPIDSPEKAVRASIVQDYKSNNLPN